MTTMPQLTAPLLRLSLGAIAGFHALRLLGALSSHSAQDKVGELASQLADAGLQRPSALAWILVVMMAVSALGLLLGALTRAAAALLFAVCLFGLALRPPLWEVNTTSDVDRLGIELLLVLMVQAVAVFNLGGGSFSVDQHRARAAAQSA